MTISGVEVSILATRQRQTKSVAQCQSLPRGTLSDNESGYVTLEGGIHITALYHTRRRKYGYRCFSLHDALLTKYIIEDFAQVHGMSKNRRIAFFIKQQITHEITTLLARK